MPPGSLERGGSVPEHSQFSFHGAVSTATAFPGVTLTPARRPRKVSAALAFPEGVPQQHVSAAPSTPPRPSRELPPPCTTTPGGGASGSVCLHGIPGSQNHCSLYGSSRLEARTLFSSNRSRSSCCVKSHSRKWSQLCFS